MLLERALLPKYRFILSYQCLVICIPYRSFIVTVTVIYDLCRGQVMAKIRDFILEKYPHISDRLLPLIDCELDKDMHISEEVATAMVLLHQDGLAIRPVCQLGALCQFSIDLDLPVEMGVDHWSGGADTWLRWQDKVLGYGGSHCRVNPALYEGETAEIKALYITRFLRFPIMHRHKDVMYKRAEELGCEEVLQKTWSCWYPKDDGSPCQRCMSCRHRFIPQEKTSGGPPSEVYSTNPSILLLLCPQFCSNLWCATFYYALLTYYPIQGCGQGAPGQGPSRL